MWPKEFKMLWPKLRRDKGALMTSIAVARRGWSWPWLSCRFTEKKCLKSVLLGLPDPNEAKATGSLSTHFGLAWLCDKWAIWTGIKHNCGLSNTLTVMHCDTSKPQCIRWVRCRHVTSVELSTLTTDFVNDKCIADAFTLPLDGSCGGGGNDELLTPPKVGPTSSGPHMISWCQPLHFLHTTLHPFAICPGNKYQKHKPVDFNLSFFTWIDPFNLKYFSVAWFFPKKTAGFTGLYNRSSLECRGSCNSQPTFLNGGLKH